MKIGILKEREDSERRVAATPATIKNFSDLGIEVYVESGAGLAASFTDSAYEEVGAKISKIPLEIISDADVILKVQPSPNKYKKNTELAFMKKGAVVVAMMSPAKNLELFKEYCKKGITSFAMELVPRITRAQSMDVLSSQSNLAGYRAIIDASYEYQKIFPMMMTAAGTVIPTKLLILGAGVAGLQAIATAKRLGAVVKVFDVRPAAKEQVESLGATFIEVPAEESQELETKGGYAKEANEDYKQKQSELIHKTLAASDIAVCTALIPGKKAPILITKQMVDDMKPGSVIVDLAAINGGNCEVTELDKVINYKGVRIIGYSNYPSRVPTDASSLYAKNLFNFVKLLYIQETKSLRVNLDDEIIKSSLITHNGYIVNDSAR
jgi:H+-translocating NAD(P) transhydrogenase subunit alpha